MKKLLLLGMALLFAGNVYADTSGDYEFKYGRFTCRVEGSSNNPRVAITDYDGSYTTEPLIFPDTINYNGVKYLVETIATTNLLSGRYVPERVVIPKSVKTVGANAFSAEDSNSITTDIEFGENVDWICEKACFGYTRNVHMKAKFPPVVESTDAFMWVYVGNSYHYGYPNIFVPRESLGNYRTSEWWEAYKDCIYAIGSLNFIELDDFNFSDGIKTNSYQKARIELVNDTRLEIRSFDAICSNPNLLDVSVSQKTEYDNWYTINLQSHCDIGVATVTTIVTMSDGSVYEQEYNIEIYDNPSSIDEVANASSSEAISIYTLDGLKIDKPIDRLSRGIYIIKYRGDNTRKIVKKR